jgi:hypothetical protein
MPESHGTHRPRVRPTISTRKDPGRNTERRPPPKRPLRRRIRRRLRNWRTDRFRVQLVNTTLTCILTLAAICLFFAVRAHRLGPPVRAKEMVAIRGPVVALADADNTVFAASAAGTITALEDTPAAATLQRITIAHPIGALAISGEDLYAIGANRITRLTLRLHVTGERNLGTLRPALISPGGCGIWVSEGSDAVACIGTNTLRIKRELPVSNHIGDLLVTRTGLWVIDTLVHELIRIDGRPPHPRITGRVAIPASAVGLAALDGRIMILDYDRHKLLQYDERTVKRVGRPLNVVLGADLLATGNSAVWIATALQESISQYGLYRHRRLGSPISVPGAPTALIVDLEAVWVGVADSDSLIRLDLRGLHVEHLSNDGAWDSPLDLPAPDWLLAALLLTLIWWAARRLWRTGNPDAGLPPYKLSRLRLLAMNPPYWLSLTRGRITRLGQRHTRRRGFGTRLPVHGEEDDAVSTTWEDVPIDWSVKDELKALKSRVTIVKRHSYVNGAGRRFGVRHGVIGALYRRRLREELEHQLVLMFGRWLITRTDGGLVRMQMNTVLARRDGEWANIRLPDDSRPWITFAASMLQSVGHDLLDGTEEQLDVLAEVPTRNADRDPLELRMVLVYHRIR